MNPNKKRKKKLLLQIGPYNDNKYAFVDRHIENLPLHMNTFRV